MQSIWKEEVHKRFQELKKIETVRYSVMVLDFIDSAIFFPLPPALPAGVGHERERPHESHETPGAESRRNETAPARKGEAFDRNNG